jgi:hypothetical protein
MRLRIEKDERAGDILDKRMVMGLDIYRNRGLFVYPKDKEN